MRTIPVSGKEIAAKVGTITHRCSFCKGPARVPEDVLAVMEYQGKSHVLVICEQELCQDHLQRIFRAIQP